MQLIFFLLLIKSTFVSSLPSKPIVLWSFSSRWIYLPFSFGLPLRNLLLSCDWCWLKIFAWPRSSFSGMSLSLLSPVDPLFMLSVGEQHIRLLLLLKQESEIIYFQGNNNATTLMLLPVFENCSAGFTFAFFLLLDLILDITWFSHGRH